MMRVDSSEGVAPRFRGRQMQDYYMRAQGRGLACFELWALARGDDLRPATEEFVTVGKVWGTYMRDGIVSPDRMYKLQCLKDVAKHNKSGKNEIIGTTRHRDPLVCGVNAFATMLLLRYGTGGVVGELPDFFNSSRDIWAENSMFTNEDGTGELPYKAAWGRQGHCELFEDMKNAAGLGEAMHDVVTKLRSYGAMYAAEGQASEQAIERSGRYFTLSGMLPHCHSSYMLISPDIPISGRRYLISACARTGGTQVPRKALETQTP